MGIFGKKPKSILGIDIGTSSIKVVQLKKEEEKFKLETYGEISTVEYAMEQKSPEANIRELLKTLLERCKTTTHHAVMAIPIFSSFTSVIEMPEMPESELVRSVEFEARKYIPIPLPEVVLDWKIIDSGMIKSNASIQPFKGKRVLLIAVPKEVANKYIKIAEELDLEVNALELESFSFSRSLVYDEKVPVCILDIGARATSFSIVDNNTIQVSHGLDIAGAEMTKILASNLGVAFKRAEDFKLTHGIDHAENNGMEQRKETKEALITLIDEILNESERLINSFQAKTGKKIEKLILNGGSAQMEGLKEYIEKKTSIKTFIANPWRKINYPPNLRSTLEELGPQFSVAVGAAMREE